MLIQKIDDFICEYFWVVIAVLIGVLLGTFGLCTHLAKQEGLKKEQRALELYNPNDSYYKDSDGNPIVWINSDNWVVVVGTDSEQIAKDISEALVGIHKERNYKKP